MMTVAAMIDTPESFIKPTNFDDLCSTNSTTMLQICLIPVHRKVVTVNTTYEPVIYERFRQSHVVENHYLFQCTKARATIVALINRSGWLRSHEKHSLSDPRRND